MSKTIQERFAMTNAFPWDNSDKETAGLPNDEEIEYSLNRQEGA
tara:strand:+ start:259 stop:390 length:132 start_codon:yes stop_codon:yes gene_type:complete